MKTILQFKIKTTEFDLNTWSYKTTNVPLIYALFCNILNALHVNCSYFSTQANTLTTVQSLFPCYLFPFMPRQNCTDVQHTFKQLHVMTNAY